MKKLFTLALSLLALVSTAQTICSSSGNVMLFTNYDGGTITINVDQNISNLKIGICSYEACQVNLSGAFVNNVTAVHYAGYNNSNNTSCGATIATTTITGAPSLAALSVSFVPATTLSNSNGNSVMVCGYSCNNNTSQGGCNTVDQIEAYFLNYFSGSSLYAHKIQYGCWTGTQSLSIGGNCCPPPPVYGGSITPSQTICAGQVPLAFSSVASASVVSGTITYQWESSTTSTNSGFTGISSANSTTYAPGALSQTTYFRRAASTSTSNIGYSDVITVNVLPLPVVAISGPTAVCAGSSTTLSATGGTSYLWNPGSSTSATTIITPAASSIVTVNVYASSGCSTTANVLLLVNPQPTIIGTSNTGSVSSPGNICVGQVATLTASGAFSYTWNPGNLTGATVTVSPLVTTIYTVQGQNATGCENLLVLALQVNALPSLSVSTSPSLTCEGNPSILMAMGATNYTWLPMNVVSPSVAIVSSIVMVYTVTGNNGLCSDDMFIVVTPLPSPTVSVGSLRQSLCKSESTYITVGGASTYTLKNSNAAILSNSILVSPTVTTNYTVTGLATNGCSNSAVQTITVSNCTGLENESLVENTELKIYPNPNNGEFYLQAEKSVLVHLVNSIGQVVRTFDLNADNTYKITVNGIAPGIYFITTTDRSFHQKLIVEKN